MRVVNKLTEPGGIRRVDIKPDKVSVKTADGRELIYRPDTEIKMPQQLIDKRVTSML